MKPKTLLRRSKPHPIRTGIFPTLIFFVLFGTLAQAAIPSTALYPFPGFDLAAVRAKTRAEWSPESKELKTAWRLYREIQGSWGPGSPKPGEEVIAQLDQLKGTLEAFPQPPWFSKVLKSPQDGQAKLADRVGDQIFEQQKSTPEYQALKALAIVYLTEHELDRTGAPQNAGMYLAALSRTHPWDWELHGLYGRFLIDARRNGPAREEAKLSVFLNPEPTLEQLKAFAFVGGIVAKEKWPEIQEAMKEAATDDRIAELAIVDSAKLFSRDMKVIATPPKKSG